MIIHRLTARNFRNYINLEMPLKSGVNILLGANGQGKTNFLEAVYLLSRGDSFRSGKSSTWIGPGIPKASILSAKILSKDTFENVIKFQLEGNRRSFFLNNKKISRAQLLELFPVVLFSPESLSAIKDGPEARRRLIDDFLLSHNPQAGLFIETFSKVLRARNRLLSDNKKGLYLNHTEVRRVLDSLEPKFFDAAIALIGARLEAIRALLPDLKNMMGRLFPGKNVDISVDYLISGSSALEWTDMQVRTSLEQRLITLRNAELNSGNSLVGPQKHDVQFLFSGNDARFFCSQGQQRALILSFKMAQIMYHHKVHHEYPILLLDDVLSELDQERRTNLIDSLKDIRSQILVTTTDLSFAWDFGSRDLAVYQVVNGEIVEASV